MSSRENGNQPAGFGPLPDTQKVGVLAASLFSTGLTKREYFAAVILQGLLARGTGGELEEDAVKRADRLLMLLADQD